MEAIGETKMTNSRAQQLSLLRTVEDTMKKSKKTTETNSVNEGRPKTYIGKISGGKMTKIALPKGSTAFQQVLAEIYNEMEEEKTTRSVEEHDTAHIVKAGKDHARHHVPSGPSSNFYRTQSVSGGYSGAFVRNQSRRMLLKSKSSREILLEKLDIVT